MNKKLLDEVIGKMVKKELLKENKVTPELEKGIFVILRQSLTPDESNKIGNQIIDFLNRKL